MEKFLAEAQMSQLQLEIVHNGYVCGLEQTRRLQYQR